MRSPTSDLPPASGWMTVDLGGLHRSWSAPVTVPRTPESARATSDTAVVSLAARREAEAARPARRVPEADVLVLERIPTPRPASAPARDDVLDLAELAPAPPSSEVVAFPSAHDRQNRARRILYLTAAGIIMATGAVYTYKSASAARAISVPMPESPSHMLSFRSAPQA